MFDPNSHILLEITDLFCPRLIVVDGLILPVSISPHFHCSGNRFWIPSTIEKIPSKGVSEQTHIHSIEIEIDSKLREIEKDGFSRTDLEFFTFSRSVGILGFKCFSECRSLSSVTFESVSRLSRIENEAFTESGLIEIIIPSSVEVLCAKCFFQCRSLSSVTFESGSRLSRVEKEAFY
jgi:hypothetical protein